MNICKNNHIDYSPFVNPESFECPTCRAVEEHNDWMKRNFKYPDQATDEEITRLRRIQSMGELSYVLMCSM